VSEATEGRRSKRVSAAARRLRSEGGRQPPVRTVGVALVMGAVVAGSAAFAGEDNTRRATRDEAAAAFKRGCRKQVDAAPELSATQRRVICDDATACVIEAMFEPDGRHKRPFSEIGNFVGPCLTRARQEAFGQPASKPGAAAGPKPDAGERDGLVACAREMKPVALDKLLAQCRRVSENSEYVCDSSSPCIFIKREIAESCKRIAGRAGAPDFCRAGAPSK
jgi:hypothetical protein